jgi:hypothetical protein
MLPPEPLSFKHKAQDHRVDTDLGIILPLSLNLLANLKVWHGEAGNPMIWATVETKSQQWPQFALRSELVPVSGCQI